MIRTWITAAIAAVLTIIGLAIFSYKAGVLHYPILPNSKVDSWYVEFSIDILEEQSEGVSFSVIKPQDNQSYAITNDQLIAPEFGIDETSQDKTEVYALTKRTTEANDAALLRFNIYEVDNDIEVDKSSPTKIDTYLEKNRLSNPDEKTKIVYEAIDNIIEDARAKSSGSISFTKQIIQAFLDGNETSKFLTTEMNVSTRESAIVNILGAAGINARIAHGFPLETENNTTDISSWIEVYSEKNEDWARLSPSTDEIEGLDDYYVWWVGDRNIFNDRLELANSIKLSTKPNSDGSLTRQIWLEKNSNSFVNFFALQTLPLEQQFVAQILLLLPLGALFVSFFRQVIGVHTIGTFMPVLIALAFRETGLVYGVIFFFGIISLGLFARAYITKLHLLMVPRLSAVMSIIVVFILAIMLLTKDQNFSLGISVALFPVVIITMFIERMSTILDEKSPIDAFYGFMGSMALATIIYLLVLNEYVMHWMFVFPEILLIVIAGCLLLGRYNGYKLMEYWRFKQMQKAVENA